jgi:hypothetical protein
MNADQFDRERLYQATIAVACVMLRQGVITEDELAAFETKMRRKYRPLLGSLWP